MDDPRSEGWLVFAGIVLMMAGAMRFFDAIWAWSYNGSVPSTSRRVIRANLEQLWMGVDRGRPRAVCRRIRGNDALSIFPLVRHRRGRSAPSAPSGGCPSTPCGH